MSKYYMGIDPYGYDGKTGTVAVIFDKGIEVGVEIVAMFNSREREDFELEVQRLTDLYKPNILRTDVRGYSNIETLNKEEILEKFGKNLNKQNERNLGTNG